PGLGRSRTLRAQRAPGAHSGVDRMADKSGRGVAAAVKRWMRQGALRRGGFIGRATAPDTRNTLGSHLASVIAALQINCVIDVGAHAGEYGRMLREIGYTGRIVSFEPVPEHYARLSEALGHDPQWRGRQIALGAADGHADMHVFKASTFASLLSPGEY